MRDNSANAIGSAYKGRIHFNGDASVLTKEVGHSVYTGTNRHNDDRTSWTVDSSWKESQATYK